MIEVFDIKQKLPERLALPSWVLPGTVAENVYFLESKVCEIALCCFEISSCLNYTSIDLPPELNKLNLRWHVHLPLDLAWDKGAYEAASQCLALREKLLFLKPYAFVLHPPSQNRDPRPFLEIFSKEWYSHNGERIFLENSTSFDLGLLDLDFLEQQSFSFCLDPAHAIMCNQEELFNSPLAEQATLVHWNAPGKGIGHRSLVHLSQKELNLYQQLSSKLSSRAVHVLELFDWRQILQSIPILRKILNLT